ncbi:MULTISPECIES: S24 family peptidase [unclassified Vibrio]|uniref:S24 family peptidase n=1 Tax=unclassified Vibrio TaxID=2614977 RepID=UPI0022CD3462|nr:S24 family peptidase [Vibrio sp. Makdt]MDA0152240.1 S24 family peptidase [Vibrio sp. Makdt]
MNVIPIKASAGLNGFESPAAEYQQLKLSLDEILVSKPSCTWLGVASGDSMVGSGIYDGDLLIIDRSEAVEEGDVIVCNLNGEFAVKQISIKNRQLISTNPNVKPVSISETDTFSNEGVVTYSIRVHKKNKLQGSIG